MIPTNTSNARRSHHQDQLGAEISDGQRRLAELATEVTHFKFLKTATRSGFQDFKSPAADEEF